MVLPKKYTVIDLSEKLIFLYLAIFPLGQIIRLRVNILGFSYPLHPIDIIAFIVFLTFILGKVKQPRFFRFFLAFLAASTLSLLISYSIFSPLQLLTGVFYLLRLSAYFSFIPIIWSIQRYKNNKKVLFNSLFAITITTAVFGWIQYLWLPDLRDLKYIGWDDHYFRMFGTFLDPAFFAIIVVFGALMALTKFFDAFEKKHFFLIVFLLVTLLLTYSRASYLAFMTGFITLLINKRRSLVKALVIVLGFFVVALPFLPRNISEAAKLERTYSILAKFDNWKETIVIFRENPLFGVGFNNLCAARIRFLGEGNYYSHACSGSDSSLLLILATTGVVGFLVFVNLIINIVKETGTETYSVATKSCTAALLVHSLFVNSLFYPWIMGWMAVLLAISLRSEVESK